MRTSSELCKREVLVFLPEALGKVAEQCMGSS